MSADLTQHASRLAGASLTTLAGARAQEGDARLEAAGWQIDLSRQRLDTAADAALLDFAAQRELGARLNDLFAAVHVNPSEDRPALHWALRAGAPLAHSESEEVRRSLEDADAFAEKVHTGAPLTTGGVAFQAIVHVGIGGSDFGPRLIVDALTPLAGPALPIRFCANLDPFDLDVALEGLDPRTTLIVGVSKSFGTEETLYNLARARDWLKSALGADWPRHMALVTANPERARVWCEGAEPHLFHLPVSVGGRFSLWSAASLSCACALGPDALAAFRAGAEAMDKHVANAPISANAAARLALLDYWNASLLGHTQRVVLAYSRRLRMLPTYLQQLEMESNGKSVTPQGDPVSGPTAPALWGGEGSIGQHSYHQWLHQGTQIVPTEFILAFSQGGDPAGKLSLAAHALAQAEVLANGRSLETILAEEPGLDRAVAAQKVHAGQRPSSFFLHPEFGAHGLGSLIALYEHRTYLSACLWGINAFDQWGVEAGKTMAGALRKVLSGEGEANDPVTAHLGTQIRQAL